MSDEENASLDLELEEILCAYKKHVIDFDETLLVHNREIAEEFVKKFIEHLNDTTGLKYISLDKQGSAFENVNVFTPNEFDYILVFAARREEIPDSEIEEEKNEIHTDEAFSDDMSVSYDTIQLPEFMNKHEEYNKFCKYWPGTNQKCLSSHKMSDWYKDGLYTFWKKMKDEPKSIHQDVKTIYQPRHHDPALTTVLLKDDGTDNNISVDMSVCIRLYGPDEDKFYIAKRPHTIDPYLEHRACVLWLPTHSIEEREVILGKDEHQRDNYRIVKALLYRQELIADDNAYIIKCIFLRNDEEAKELLSSESPTEYLNYFLESLQRAYTLELKRRVEDISEEEKAKDTIQGYMNPQENVLARYGTNLIERKLLQLKKLMNLRDNEPVRYRRKLMSKDLDKLPKKIIKDYKLAV